MEKDVVRLAELLGGKPTKAQTEEAIGLAVGLLGSAVISLDRIADALERAHPDPHA